MASPRNNRLAKFGLLIAAAVPNIMWACLASQANLRPSIPASQQMADSAHGAQRSTRKFDGAIRPLYDQQKMNMSFRRPYNGSAVECSRMAVVSQSNRRCNYNKLCGRPRQYAPAQACKLTLDLLTLKVVSESRTTWATSVPILVFLGFRLRSDVRDRQTSDTHNRLMLPPYINVNVMKSKCRFI